MNALEEIEAALIQGAPFVVVLEDGNDHRSLQVEARPKGHPHPFRVVICDREGTWVAHDGCQVVRAHGWIWNERPEIVLDTTTFHGVRDDYGELSVVVTAEDVCAQLVHLLSAMIEIIAACRRLRPPPPQPRVP